MRRLALLLLLLSWRVGLAQTRPVVAVPVTDSLVRFYLNRAMTMQGFSGQTPAERHKFAAWAGAAGTRFAGRVGGFWYTPENPEQERAQFDTLRHNVAILHRARPGMVVQGTIFEVLWPHASNMLVLNAARTEFGEDTLAVPRRTFRFADMMYPGYFSAADSNHYRWDSRPPGQAPGTPDMSRTETQLFFYCQARREIDAGCEALHFGQVMLMDDRDPGHRAWWSMLQRVRAYARARNQGFVLCDAHTHGEYYDPDPQHPLPDSARQLLFDFHSCPIRPAELDTLLGGSHGARLVQDFGSGPTGSIIGRSKGGVTPGGYRVAHQRALVEFDNFGNFGHPGRPRQWPCVWGHDEISWYATQPSAYRDQWLVYANAYLPQLDPNVQLEMPGMRGVTDPPYPGWLYRADQAGQAEVIPAIWAGKTQRWNQQMRLIGPPAQP